LSLPLLDGVEATRLILDERDVPVVALTGHSRGDFVQRAEAAGAVGHVLKPFSRVELVATVSGALAERAEQERRRYLPMIESMVRAGHSEKEITHAVEASRRRDNV
jgi:DNA-binding NarL/FixJ family response regulator